MEAPQLLACDRAKANPLELISHSRLRLAGGEHHQHLALPIMGVLPKLLGHNRFTTTSRAHSSDDPALRVCFLMQLH